MADRTVIQWDKDDLDALGLLKVDCLALGMLSAIRRALAMVSQHRGVPTHACRTFPPRIPQVYAMCQRADTDRRVPDRVARAAVDAAAIEARVLLRSRDRGRDRAARPDPGRHGASLPASAGRDWSRSRIRATRCKSVLERTLGVPIFQEQVMQLAIVAAGFTPGEADQLRRSMAAWRRKGGLEKFEQRLIDGMGARGYVGDVRAADLPADPGLRRIRLPGIALGVVRAARLRLGVAQALRARGVLRRAAQLAADGLLRARAARAGCAPARRRGAAADVTISDWDCTLERRRRAASARCGSACAWSPGLTEAGAQRIVAARARAPFASVADLAHRAALDRARPRAPRGRATRSQRSPAIATTRCGTSPASSSCRRSLPGGHVRRSAPRSCRADRRPGHRRRLPRARADAAAGIRSRCCARQLARAAAAHRRTTSRSTPHGRLVRTAGIVIGRQRPDTASGVIFVHARGRDRRDQRHRLARSSRSPAARAAGLAADGAYTARSSAKATSCTCSPGGSSTSRPCSDRCRRTRGTSTSATGRLRLVFR